MLFGEKKRRRREVRPELQPLLREVGDYLASVYTPETQEDSRPEASLRESAPNWRAIFSGREAMRGDECTHAYQETVQGDKSAIACREDAPDEDDMVSYRDAAPDGECLDASREIAPDEAVAASNWKSTEPSINDTVPRRAESAPVTLAQGVGMAYDAEAGPDWEEMMRQADAGFTETLLQLIEEKGMTDSECYRKANVDRKLFSKIRSNPAYTPAKSTVFAFAVALELNLSETRDLLDKAGYSLTHSSKFDIILEYFIRHRRFNLYEINEVLYSYDMPLLGSRTI